MKNKSTLGLTNFIKEYFDDCKKGLVGEWFNEQFKRDDRINVQVGDETFTQVYSVAKYIKASIDKLDEEWLSELLNQTNAYYLFNRKRVYFWEINEEEKEFEKEEDVSQPEVEEEPEDPTVPDFEYAKTITVKKELKEYALKFGCDINAQKSLSNMMKSFQGMYHATKNKNKDTEEKES